MCKKDRTHQVRVTRYNVLYQYKIKFNKDLLPNNSIVNLIMKNKNELMFMKTQNMAYQQFDFD
jgi:hypothetical protein